MAKRRTQRGRRSMPEATPYNEKTLVRDREYGFYWYSWLWRALRPLLVFLCSLIIVLGAMASGWKYVENHYLLPVDAADTQTREFVIEKGSSITQIGTHLYEQGFLRNKSIFRYIVQFKGLTSKIQYGSYPLSSSMTLDQIVSLLTAGSATNERTITVIPGWTVTDIADYLVAQGALKDKKEFLSLCNNVDLFKADSYSLQQAVESGKMKGRLYALEGYLAPDTYRVYSDASAETLLRTLLKQTDAVIDSVFNSTDVGEMVYDESGNLVPSDETEAVEFQTKLTQEQTLVLASLIEREAGQKSDYAKVSAVFHNRLDAGMRLESDATAAYPLGVSRMVLTSDELSSENPYNTYQIDGLPTGPICNPSKAAISAALHPDTDYIFEGYLYFCATQPNSKTLEFSKTKAEHEAAVAKYRPLWVAYDKRVDALSTEATAAPTAVPAG